MVAILNTGQEFKLQDTYFVMNPHVSDKVIFQEELPSTSCANIGFGEVMFPCDMCLQAMFCSKFHLANRTFELSAFLQGNATSLQMSFQ